METGNISPIIRYMKPWSLKKITEYCQKKKWDLAISHENKIHQIIPKNS